jgi:hypothetical protein
MKICVGIDAAKVTHWAVAVDGEGRVVLDRAVENDPEAIDGFVAELRGLGQEMAIGLDVVGSFARFLEATLLAEGFALVHTPGIAVNRAGQGFAGGERKSDPRDAARHCPRTMYGWLPRGKGVSGMLASGRLRPCIRRLICSTVAARPDECPRSLWPQSSCRRHAFCMTARALGRSGPNRVSFAISPPIAIISSRRRRAAMDGHASGVTHLPFVWSRCPGFGQVGRAARYSVPFFNSA